MESFLTENEVTEEDPLQGEVLVQGEVLLLGIGEVLKPHGDGMRKTLMMTSVIDPVGEVVEILKVAAVAGLEQEVVKAVEMIG